MLGVAGFFTEEGCQPVSAVLEILSKHQVKLDTHTFEESCLVFGDFSVCLTIVRRSFPEIRGAKFLIIQKTTNKT